MFHNKLRLWFMTKRQLITANLRMQALYRDQQDAIVRLTRALEATQQGGCIPFAMRAFYDLGYKLGDPLTASIHKEVGNDRPVNESVL